MADRISNNAADFSRSLMAMSDYATQGMEKVIRKACIDLYRRIAKRTPFETGRAKANWSISVGTPDTSIKDQTDYVSEIARQVSGFKFDVHDGMVYITNNLEYIEKLETGYSRRQAPNGMVAVSLAEFTTHFNNELQGLEGIRPL